MRVYLAQIRPFLGDVEKNLIKHEAEIEKALTAGCDMIVFPELSLTGYYLQDLVSDVALREDDPEIQRLIKLSETISIVFGFVYESEESLFYNAAAYLEDGEIKHIHRKVYLPDYTMFEEARYFAAGDRFLSFDTKFGKCGMLLCEDSLHISSSYIMSQSGVQNLFILSNSPARGVSGDALHAADLWQMSNRYTSTVLTVNLIFVNRVGVEDGVAFWGGSEVYSALGEKRAALPMFEETGSCVELDQRDIRRARIANPFFRDEKPAILMNFLRRRFSDEA
ncbi:nitrilase-related carbon-nitrogen hydrolase [Limisalsivibrio acetivorans]|uniref:nitrilase-related carbon-nitrogen hydrolase n=1 Tax=Limisalsivibrio acetivorans TaxID=1304888 RepID=UPI0003B566E7|nr:nitrilase-related carbon-nitrogen hydrolase [Limisalsivibrio acetivorans]